MQSHINMLCKKTYKFKWDVICQNSFDTLKSSMIQPSDLQYLDFKTIYEYMVQVKDPIGYLYCKYCI